MGIFNALANVFAAVDQVGLIAIGAGLGIVCLCFYPLTTARMQEVQAQLAEARSRRS